MKKALILLLSVGPLFSCSKDTNNDISRTPLVGTWQRSDINDSFEFQYQFLSDYSGIQTVKNIDSNQNEISSAISFFWSVTDDLLTLNFDAEEIITQFTINSSGQLILLEFNEYYFYRVD